MITPSLIIRRDTFTAAMVGFEKQIPYAMATVINLGLFAARTKMTQELPSVFTVRTPWSIRGLHVEKAKKSDITGRVGFLESRWYMESQVEGDSARAKPGDKPIWQPVATGIRSPRPTFTKPILPSRRPHVAGAAAPGGSSKGKEHKVKATNEAGYFKILTSSTLFPGIYYRPSDLSRKIVAAYWQRKTQPIARRYNMMRTVNRLFSADFPAWATKAIDRALKTNKKGAG